MTMSAAMPASISNDDPSLALEFQNFAYSVSHDLSAPVRAMVEFSKLLSSEYTDALSDEAKQYLALIIGSGGKLQAMMEALLQYSRVNTMAKPLADIETEPVLKACLAAAEKRLDRPAAEIETGKMPAVHADADQLRQLFDILVDNAVKFQPRGLTPHIRITAEPQGSLWRFSVIDDGIGIAPQHAEKIFKLFQRLHTDEEYPGVGMGLTIAQKIVRRHGGALWFEPREEGSAFHFTLPRGNSGK